MAVNLVMLALEAILGNQFQYEMLQCNDVFINRC